MISSTAGPLIRKFARRPLASFAGMAAFLAVLLMFPLVFGSYPRYILSMWLIYGIAAIGLYIPMGLAGIYSFGHGGFMLIGAYVTGVAMANWDWPFWMAMPLSVVVAALIGAVVGLPSLRLTGFSLGIVTFALGMVLFQTVKAFEYTGGPQGIFIPTIDAAKWLDGCFFYYLSLLLFLIGFSVAFSLSRSKTGRALRTLASSEIVAVSLGINLLHYKVLAFVLSSIYGAFAGSLLALITGYVAPETYSPELSIDIFAAVMIGGSSVLAGPVLGALFSVLIPEMTQNTRGLGAIIYALIFCLVATLFPTGLAGMIRSGWELLTRRSRQSCESDDGR